MAKIIITVEDDYESHPAGPASVSVQMTHTGGDSRANNGERSPAEKLAARMVGQIWMPKKIVLEGVEHFNFMPGEVIRP